VSQRRPSSFPLLGAARAPLGVAAARLRSEPLRPALVVVGVALAFALLVSVLGGSLVARQQALGRALAALPESARGFRVDLFGAPLDQRTYREKDLQARRALATLSGGRARRVVFFRELRVQGELVEIAAVDDLASIVRLRSGRLPRTCTAAGCELLQIGGGGSARLAQGTLRLDRVGIAELRNPALFSYVSAAGVSSSRPTLLLGPGVDALQRLDALTPFYRVYSWLSSFPTNRLRTWDVGPILADGSHAQQLLGAADPAFRLSGPDDALRDGSRRGTIAAQRLALVGGEASALLLGFALISAIGLSRGLASERRRLLARGARRWQVALATGIELGAITLAGALAGIAAGAVAVAAIADAGGFPVGAVLDHALLTGPTDAALAGAWLVATFLLASATFARDNGGEGRKVRVVDVAALGAAAAIGVGLSRGALDPESVSSGNKALLLVLPALVCFVAAVALSRLLAPAMRAAERLTRASSTSLRLAVLALGRAPARTVVSCAFVAVALGLALFAAGYRATLADGAGDQAAFDVPLDFTVGEGSGLVPPLDAAPIARYERLGGGARAYPVVRASATVPGSGSRVLSPTVLGVPADAIARLHWRSDFSAVPLRTIAARLAPNGEPRPARLPVPAGTRTLAIAARLHGNALAVGLVVADERGRTSVLPMGLAQEGSTIVSARLPRGTRSVLGLRLMLPAREQFVLAHRETEGVVSTAPAGTLVLGPLRAGGGTVTSWRGWSLPSGGSVVREHGGVRLRYAFETTGGSLVFRPAEPTEGRPMPVVVSPDVARAAGGVGARTELDFQDASVAARIVGVARRLPTVPGSAGPFVLADGAWLSTAIGANAPGEGRPNEVWLSASGDRAVAAALRRPPFAGLAVASRTEIERRLAGDPLAHATGLALGAAAIMALVLAVVGFWVGILSELHDERSDFFDLEAQGVPPASLRAQLRTRGVVLLIVGLAAGTGLGALLSRLVVSLVRVSATTGVPEPPLRLDPAWLVSGLGILALAAAALLVAECTSLAAFRASRPERASWSLE
jgi:hypothetical protein